MTERIEVSVASLAQPADALRGLAASLSNEERDRAARFGSEMLRDRYVAGRGLLRQWLSRHVGRAAGSITIDYGVAGKPIVREDPPLYFNVSHSGDLFACAITRAGEVGIDVEQHRPIDDFEDIARRFFSAPEVEALTQVQRSDRLAAFYQCWTRKEAFLKATGEGFSRPLDTFAVSLGPSVPARLVWLSGGDPAEWTLHSFQPTPAASGAVAIFGSAAEVVVR